MRHYYCKKCGFSGIRPIVRKHIREEHMINKKGVGSITDNMIVLEAVEEYGNSNGEI